MKKILCSINKEMENTGLPLDIHTEEVEQKKANSSEDLKIINDIFERPVPKKEVKKKEPEPEPETQPEPEVVQPVETPPAPIKKQKKPRSEAQIKALEKARIARAEKARAKKELALKNAPVQPETKEAPTPKPANKQPPIKPTPISPRNDYETFLRNMALYNQHMSEYKATQQAPAKQAAPVKQAAPPKAAPKAAPKATPKAPSPKQEDNPYDILFS